MRFSEIDSRVLRYLEERFIAGGERGVVMPDEIMGDNGIDRAQCIRLVARFTTLGILKHFCDDGTVEITDLVCHYVAEFDHASSSQQSQDTVNSSQGALLPISADHATPDAQTVSSLSREISSMDVLISWSKTRSREVATLFHGWLPRVLPGLAPWMSDKDIDKGTEWFAELQGLLGRAKLCIICVTAENVRSPWLYYETGAIAAKLHEQVRVCPYLFGIGPSMLSDGPLGKWQCTLATKTDTLALIRSLNNVLGEGKRHDETLLEGNFEARWPEFENELSRILALDLDAGDEFIATEADQLAGYNLTPEARTLLTEASKDENGLVLFVLRCAQTNGRCLTERGNPRSEAKWKQAITDLVACGLLEPRGYKGEVFAVTAKGFEVTDLLQGKTHGSQSS